MSPQQESCNAFQVAFSSPRVATLLRFLGYDGDDLAGSCGMQPKASCDGKSCLVMACPAVLATLLESASDHSQRLHRSMTLRWNRTAPCCLRQGSGELVHA
eukprot:509777-Amphidinium_carterae.1